MPKATTTATGSPVRDYTKYANQTETPRVSEKRMFDSIKVSGAVERDADEKRLPAVAKITYVTRPKVGDKYAQEVVQLPFSVVPLKYRAMLEERDNDGIVVRFSSEYNGNRNDMVVIGTKQASGKTEFSKPMTASTARNTYVDADGKSKLREVVHLYALFNGQVVRFNISGSALWESAEIQNGKSEASRMKHDSITAYLSKFAANDPYFLYTMNVDAVYRDHRTVTYYRPIFTKGARIDAATEDAVLAHIEDLHTYFADLDKENKNFIPTVEEVEGMHDEDIPSVVDSTDTPDF